MILEGIVTTQNADGTVNVSPMGPIVDDEVRRLVLRPFNTSRTCANLKRTREGVFHVTDDVELLAHAAVDDLASPPPLAPAEGVRVFRLADCCRWYAFKVKAIDDRQERVTMTAEVVVSGRIRDFLGFNRARHAVVEAAILATRTAILPAAQIRDELRRLAPLVEKTGGARERRAFEFLQEYIGRALVGS
ncbi:MAG: DUF447 family protein [Planctomycetia bacterium]|nr:DUF447 family protein [Planctomycetia bacterium]